MNTELCHIQNEIVQKYGLGGRIEVRAILLVKFCKFCWPFQELRTCDFFMFRDLIFFPQTICNDVCNVGALLNQGK